MQRTLCYLSGPVTKGDRRHNLQQAQDAGKVLIDAGYSVIIPHLTMLLPYAWHVPHQTWMEIDEPIVRRSDCLLRLPGESLGADMEVGWASEEGIPVFYSVDALLAGMAP